MPFRVESFHNLLEPFMYILLVLCACCIGCSSSNIVYTADESSSSAFNEEAIGAACTVVFKDEKEVSGRDIAVSQDSTVFMTDAGLMYIEPTSSIKKVVFTNHAISTLVGLGAGIGVGSAAGYAVGSASEGDLGDPGDLAFIGSLFGGGIGALIGMAVGYDYVYEFNIQE